TRQCIPSHDRPTHLPRCDLPTRRPPTSTLSPYTTLFRSCSLQTFELSQYRNFNYLRNVLQYGPILEYHYATTAPVNGVVNYLFSFYFLSVKLNQMLEQTKMY